MMDKVDPVGLLTSFLRDVENNITKMRADDPGASQVFADVYILVLRLKGT